MKLNEVNKMKTCLTKFVGLIEHVESCSPSNITVQWNLQGLRKSAKDLGTLEVLNLLSGRLNLSESRMRQREISKFRRTMQMVTYFDSQGSDCSDNIKGAT